ncbi:unnamed protein product [Eruca vesicaria subsp. sativa]|uniref:MADS-box domain-containing protein n=1 Tax=Eruca vesicaria subsp. sativa TaxID=29727 RepID=A0ABC8JSK6_ERUVS|nr:unnamed protein product [Eruca vesicaria subsp. sativa]
MVKRGGGTKRKPEMKKIADKASRATTFSKRREGLYSKAAQLCVISDAQIAILATPSSSNSNASFFSFGHSSVDSIVSAYLSGKRLPPVSSCGGTKAAREDLGICMARMDLGLGFWWNDEKLVNSKNREELMEAMKSMEVLMEQVKELKDQALTTTLPPSSSHDDLDEWSEMELNQLLQDDCDDDAPPPHVVVSNTEKEEEDQTVSEKTCNNNMNFVSLPETAGRSLEESLEEEKMDIDWDTVFVFDEELSDDVSPPVVGNTDKEEEDQNLSEKPCNNGNSMSVPEAAGRSLEDLDLDSIFEGLASFDDQKLLWSDELLFM